KDATLSVSTMERRPVFAAPAITRRWVAKLHACLGAIAAGLALPALLSAQTPSAFAPTQSPPAQRQFAPAPSPNAGPYVPGQTPPPSTQSVAGPATPQRLSPASPSQPTSGSTPPSALSL